MGETDRLIRVLLAVVIAVLIWIGFLPYWLALALGALGIIFLLTSLFRFCPLYVLFKISTVNKTKA
jgi:ABC-type anion transport system duplicated permease subunit